MSFDAEEKKHDGGENKMGVMPVKQLIISMSLPMMISMLVQALYNIVDSIFVARVSEDALTAVTLAFPIQSLMIAVGSGTGVGVNAILSRALGEKNFKKANDAANTGVLLSFFSFLLFLLIGIFVARPFIASQASGPNAAIITEYGSEYLFYVCVLSIGLFFQMMFERLLQSTGRTLQSMISQMTGAIINIILDPMLIFGIGPFPELGVKGAAVATVFGQVTASILAIIMNVKTNKDIQLSLKEVLTAKWGTIKQIYLIGIPSILMMSIGSVMTYLFNQILIVFSSTAVAVFGVYFKLQSFFFMPIFGLNNGLIPVLAFNYGARRSDRIKEALSFSLRLAVCVMVFGTICFELIPGVLLKLFNASEGMNALGIPALRIIAIHFPVAAICIVLGSVFQAFAKSSYSLVVSLGRQLVVLIPAAWLLSLLGNVNYVWFAFPIAEVMSLFITSIFFKKIKREIIDQL